ncbi:MAG: hypothetical protein AAFQ65_11350 [Myxococcota bacterium]
MRNTILLLTSLTLASVTGFYGCSGEDDPTTTPTDMADDLGDAGEEGPGSDDSTDPDAPAGIAQGDPCADDGDACPAGLTCVEGVCCDTPCEGVCRSCLGDVSGGFDGECMLLALGDEVVVESLDYEDCPGPPVCDGQGACFAQAAGEGCDADNQCTSGFCSDGVCCDARCSETCRSCESGACVAVTQGPDPGTCDACFGDGTCDGIDIGENCTRSTECSSGVCDSVCVLPDDAVCGEDSECLNACVNGTCVPLVGVAGACDTLADCLGDLTCLSGLCVGPDGAECASNTECVATCISERCEQPSIPGNACDSDDDADCLAPASCDDGVCRLPDGEVCSDPGDCLGDCIDGTCSTLPSGPSPGDPCTGTCAAGLVCSSSDEVFEGQRRCRSTTTNFSFTATAQNLLREGIDVEHTGTLTISCRDSVGASQSVSFEASSGQTNSRSLTCAIGAVIKAECSAIRDSTSQPNTPSDFRLLSGGLPFERLISEQPRITANYIAATEGAELTCLLDND